MSRLLVLAVATCLLACLVPGCGRSTAPEPPGGPEIPLAPPGDESKPKVDAARPAGVEDPEKASAEGAEAAPAADTEEPAEGAETQEGDATQKEGAATGGSGTKSGGSGTK